ncbi:MAG: hypothetical protein FVQ80_02525 [Planctomycetes bacterium]|nr:hypothetical protein [Planctomycetota bacterium]
MTATEYFDKLPRLLMRFQYIEEVLKMYIHTADLAIHVKMKGLLHYEVPGKELWKQPLGSLIREFNKRTDKKDIVAILKELVEDRNFFAHEGYLLTIEQQKGKEDISELLGRLDATRQKAGECLKSLIKEASRIRGEKISEELLDQFTA